MEGGGFMRYLIAVLALAGLVVSCFALREHYRTTPSPCSINERWDCGAVNHSPFAEIGGILTWLRPGAQDFLDSHPHAAELASIPVAGIGIAGYLLIAGFALARRWWIVLLLASVAVAISAGLTYIEARLLETYCIWCVSSAVLISLTELAAITAVLRRRR
jgi:vitamin-K-epoxide reductase (warfarin-sensitive)